SVGSTHHLEMVFVWKQNYILVDEYFFFCCTWIVNSARYAAQGYFASPLLHFVHALSCPKRTAVAIDSLLALGHTSGADTLLGFWLGQQLLQGKP
ncbi:DUF2877 domain-containing protein, partial [Escherichia coli]|uniref:oxamate carbamoyltransferase subunit AllH family protein n=1 Tax=Escherichia coli TaxID=562 RepID=UPI0028769A1B